MDCKVSVIIPVYNAAPYLGDCIRSLLNQTLRECEFIFINDGSQDASQTMIEGYMQEDRRIKLMNQENQGVSMARNRGLLEASGEYIGFVDADDYVKSDMFEVLYVAAKEDDCDVVVSHMASEIDGQQVVTSYPFPRSIRLDRSFIEVEVLSYFLKSDHLNTAVNKLYRRHLIEDHRLIFPEKVALGEDGMFNIQFFSVAMSMKCIDYTGYFYREVIGSATRNLKEKDYFHRALEVYRSIPPSSITEIHSNEHIQHLKAVRLIHATMSYIHMYYRPHQDWNFIKRHRYVKRMITHRFVQEALPKYVRERDIAMGRFEKLFVSLIKMKWAFGLWCAATYSRLRNP